MEIELLRKSAHENRKKIIDLVYFGKAGHPGGALSIIDVLTTIYAMDVDLKNPVRSKVILSKGHAVAAQYACLHSKGVLSDEDLHTFRTVNSRLQGHPHTVSLPEVDATTGLLGQGLSIGVGMAVAKRINHDNHRVYVVVGDGELHEGQIWESVLQAAQFKLSNLVLFVDYNKLSSSGNVNEVINLDPLPDKFKAFNWNTYEIDGHDYTQILDAMDKIRNNTDNPIVFITHTVKGKGISYMENNPAWHSGTITDEQYAVAMKDLGVN